MKKAQIDPTKLNFQPVETTVNIAGGANRDPAGGVTYKSGRTPLNVAGSEAYMDLRHEAGIEQGMEGAYYEVDAMNKVVSVRPVLGAGSNIMPVRYMEGTNLVSLHLGGVYKEYPKLRPLGKSAVTVMRGQDSAGNDCLFILLAAALTKSKQKTDSNKPRKKRNRQEPENKDDKQQPGTEPDTPPEPELEDSEEQVAASEDEK